MDEEIKQENREMSASQEPVEQSLPERRSDEHDSAMGQDETSVLRELQADARDQDDVERDITRQAERLLIEQADERDKKRLEKTRKDKEKLELEILKLHQRLSQPIGTAVRVQVQNALQKAELQLSTFEKDLEDIQQRIDERGQEEENVAATTGAGRMPNESRRDYLIRTGKITPFSNMSAGPREGPFASLSDALLDAEDERDELEALDQANKRSALSHRNLQRPDAFADRPPKRRRVSDEHEDGDDSVSYVATEEADSSFGEDGEFLPEEKPRKRKTPKAEDGVEDFSRVDDGDEKLYQSRLKTWVSRRSAARKRALKAAPDDEDLMDEEDRSDEPEWFKPHPTEPDGVYDNGFRVPGDIYPSLFDYQKTGVQWLWELYQQQVGGIVGDEMGLGKTIQVIAFLAGLHYTKMLTKPVIVVCPATVMKQWVNEFHTWWPPFRVSILHTSGSGMVNIRSESSREDALLSKKLNSHGSRAVPKGYRAAQKIVKRVVEEGHVLVTTYSGLQTYSSLLSSQTWGAAILDEGHKIRNPDTAIAFHCKELRTPHRYILSGTPMQNNLTELWSLFDFVFPMRLGTLVDFRNQFDFPIRQGGYANASNLQVQTAAKCAEILKDAISPYLLQRFKVDVAADLPKKSEVVLFCKLVKPQRAAYEAVLGSDEMKSILKGNRTPMWGVDMLRKICNHPDLAGHKLMSHKADYGNPNKSGKMQIVKELLELWKRTGHKTLLFTQHRITLDILEKFINSLSGFNYRRMDGTTPIPRRQPMVDEFNADPDIHVFLLTTKVGGVGVNLTGADRVLIYDPDWNPSTDMQARERAWRLGQKRDVKIYRLMLAGTIEEKIYHRQIFKQFLTNKVLKDPKQQHKFQMSDLLDLFTLGSENQGATETSEMFKDAEVAYDEGSGGTLTQPEAAVKSEDENKDISKFVGVAGMEDFKNDSEQPSDEAGTPEATNSETRLMQGIFSRSGVHSALEHDHVINGKRVVRADPKIIEAEAKKVAAEAAEALRKAGEAARSVPIGVPTWTGQSGVAGRPDEAPVRSPFGGSSSTARRAGAGPSSASILANLAHGTPSSRSNTGSPAPTRAPQGVDFIKMIRDYIIAQGGSVFTQMLVNHFSRYCTTPQQSAQFQQMLKQIAVLERGRNGRGKWSLKPEYANVTQR